MAARHGRWRGLAMAAHPVPALVVTGLVLVLAWGVGVPTGTLMSLGTVVLLGQLSVGWSNDAADADLDRAARRVDKPVVRGYVSELELWRAAAVALGGTVLLSVALLGWVAGMLHILAVAAAWAYNVRVKDTPFSPVPYAIGFCLLPVVVGLLTEPPLAVPGWFVLVCGAVGVAAHLANASPDVASDQQVGRGGLAVRLGARRARWSAAGVLAAAAVLLLVSVPTVTMGLAAATTLAVLVVVAAAVLGRGAALFPTIMLVAGTAAAVVAVAAPS
jgi:4-hydroxybenzoate polyprenyltransferase